MTPKTICFLPENQTVEFSNETSVLDVALKNKVALAHSCGGMGSCTTCRVWIESGLSSLPERTDLEKEITEGRDFSDHERLACQLAPQAGLIVRIPPQRT